MNERMTVDYMNDEKFHRTYLRDHPERENSPWVVGLAAAAGVGGSLLAYRKGLLRPVMERAIQTLGSYRNGEIDAVIKGIRNYAEGEGGGSIKYRMDSMLQEIKKSRSALQTRREMLKDQSVLIDREGELLQMVTQRNEALRDLDTTWGKMTQAQQAERGSQDAWKMRFQRQMDDYIKERNNVTQREQDEHIRRTGFRYATLNDLMKDDVGHLSKEQQHVFRAMKEDFRQQYGDDAAEGFMNKIYDKNVLVNNKNNTFSDLRDFRAMTNDVMDTISDDFTTPFVKINPVRMLYMNRFSAVNQPPVFHVVKGNTRQPAISNNTDALGTDHIYIGGNVFDTFDPSKAVAENVRLVDGKAGPVARYYRNISGLTASSYKKPNTFWGNAKYNTGNFLKLGFQDEPIGRDISWNFKVGNQSVEGPNLMDPTTWASWGAQKVHNVTRPYESARRIALEDAFGKDADWIVFNNYKTVEQSGSLLNYGKQFTAGRNNLDDVTTATLFPYGFFERLNSTLNQVALGLPNDSLGSAFNVVKDLVLYRIAPVWLGVEAWKYINTESDNFLGFQFEDKFANFYANTSTDVAGIRDALGITDWAKHMTGLFPGGEQIADIPFVGHFLDWNDSEEETRQYWESGEDAVRKGRYWEFGNTPFTGSKIEYYEPNWVRKTVSDYEFTDTMYGSRDEYFANHILPTPTHPFSTLNALFFDPYHWEEKHYYDRPYLATGGIPILDEFPLIGPALGATIGQVFKPEKQMHQEYWNTTPEGGLFATNVDGKLSGPEFDDVTDDVYYDPVQTRADAAGLYGASDLTATNGNTYELGVVEATGGGGAGAVSGNMIMARQVRDDEQTIAAYTTPSGQVTPAVLPNDQFVTVNSLNQAIKEKALSSANRDVQMMDRLQNSLPITYEPAPVVSPNDVEGIASNFYYNLTEMGGAYGFFTTIVAGNATAPNRIADAGEMTSLSRSFWDMNIGNLGGDANEIFRRFLPRDTSIGKNYNPVPNTMPSWLPGSEYFTDFQHGDPYTKLKKGEMRLPGEAYERLYGIDSEELDKDIAQLRIGASGIGYDTGHIVNSMLRRDEVMDEDMEDITESGTGWHEDWEQDMLRKGIAMSSEQWVEVEGTGVGGFYDAELDNARMLEYAMENADVFKYYRGENGGGEDQYGGFYDDGIDMKALAQQNPEQFRSLVSNMMQNSPVGIGDLKTMSDKKFQQQNMFFENAQQVNYYLGATGNRIGFLIHANRDMMNATGDSPVQVYAFDYNPGLYEYSMSKVEAARSHIRQGMRDGSYGRGDFYDMIDQYRILSDVAPYSDQYRKMKDEIGQWQGLTEEDKLEIQEINDQGGARKEDNRMYPYRFKTANIEKQRVTVTKVIDNNMFMVEGFENPIKMAGLRSPAGKDDPAADKARSIIGIREGDSVTIGIDADELRRVNNDTYNSISAVLYRGGVNINRELIESGVAKEKENDYSPTGVHARFSGTEIELGRLWETWAHLDTPYHTKFLQVRSPLESYERREVYGKDWQEWNDPVNDFFIPWFQQTIERNPILALATGTLLGRAFGNTNYGRLVGGAVGFVGSLLGVAYVNGSEEITGEKWVPDRRKKEWEMNEYLDTLKYVKYRRLYEYTADQAQREEGVNVRKMIADRKRIADRNSAEKSQLEELKRRIKTGTGAELEEAMDEARKLLEQKYDYLLEKSKGDVVKALNARLNEMTNDRTLEEIGPMAAQALTYYNESEKTMFAYDAGEPLQNLLSALPKKDQDYLAPFMQAPEEERDEILGVVPDYMKRVLQASYGVEVDEKPDLDEYFLTHGLPDQSWIGWDPRATLEDVKVKMVKKEKLDPSEFDIWDQDVQHADMARVEAPDIHEANSVSQVQSRLHDVLRGIGLEDIQVNVTERGRGEGSQVSARIAQDRREEIVRRMNEDAVNLM